MQINRRTLLAAGAGLASGLSLPAWAQLRIEITGVGANQMPIAIPQFQGTNNAPLDLSAVVTADLERSGAFRAPRFVFANLRRYSSAFIFFSISSSST